jgi:ferredoxin
MLGIGYPIHGFEPPAVVHDFIKRLGESEGQSVFLYSICTGPHYLNMIASLDIRRALEHKGFSVFHECQFHVPPGVSTHYPAATLTQLYQAAARKALRVANELWQGTPRVAPAPLLLPIARSLLQARRAPQRPSSMDFKVQDTCSLCGTCVAACPAKNISVQDGRVRFGQTCVGCYRCVHRCPHGAITSSDSRRTLRRIARLTPTSTVLQTDQEESVLLAQSFQGSR